MKKKKNQGMTMVEVLMGFVLLMLILGMLSGSIYAANQIYLSSVDLRKAQESLQREIYKKDLDTIVTPAAVTLKLVPKDGMPESSTDIELSGKLYRVSSDELLSDVEKESVKVTLSFVK